MSVVGDYFGYGISALTAVGAIVFGVRQAGTADRAGMAERLGKIEGRLQMLERREVVHEHRELILVETLRDHQIAVPELPPFPESWTA